MNQCGYCGKDFDRRHNFQKYCSLECRKQKEKGRIRDGARKSMLARSLDGKVVGLCMEANGRRIRLYVANVTGVCCHNCKAKIPKGYLFTRVRRLSTLVPLPGLGNHELPAQNTGLYAMCGFCNPYHGVIRTDVKVGIANE